MSDDYDDLNDPLDMAAFAYEQNGGGDEASGGGGFGDLSAFVRRTGRDPESLLDKEVLAIYANLDAEVDKVAARRINPNAPAADFLLRSRNQQILATRQLYNVAKGETPEDFVEPDKAAPAYVTPKAASGFAVVNAKRRRVVPAPAPAPAADPVPAPTRPAYKPTIWNF